MQIAPKRTAADQVKRTAICD